MMTYILDCSFCVSIFLPDEQSDRVVNAFGNIQEMDEVYIPQLWWYETSNVLSIAVNRKRLMHNDVLDIIQLFTQYNFITDINYGKDYSEKLFSLSQLYSLSAYDAAYIELAIRKNGILGTLDEKQKKACSKAGIQVL